MIEVPPELMYDSQELVLTKFCTAQRMLSCKLGTFACIAESPLGTPHAKRTVLKRYIMRDIADMRAV